MGDDIHGLSNPRFLLPPLTEYSLLQNYPSPLNPSTTIWYALPEAILVRLVVFNSVGQSVVDLVDEAQEARDHEARFDGTSLASCVCFFRLQAGEFVRTNKLVLSKSKDIWNMTHPFAVTVAKL